MTSQADHIRRYAVDHYIEPARKRGAKEVSIRAGDLAKDIGLENRQPNICNALFSKKLQQLADVPAPIRTGPPQGNNTTFTYKLAGGATGAPDGKAMAKPGQSRGDTQAKVEAKLDELNAKFADLNKRTEDVLAGLRWYPYLVGLALFGLGVVVSRFLF